MKKIYLTILLVAFAVVFSSAQQPLVNLKGQVINKETGAPISGQIMYVMLDSLFSAYSNKAITDERGFYSFSIPTMYDTTKVVFAVYTYDCNGSIVYVKGKYLPITIDFSICGNSQAVCQAMFKYIPIAANTLKYEFYNGSSIIPGTTPDYLWDFGDGITSSEQNPVHSFSKPGLYNVCLSIRSIDSSCNSIFCLPVQAGITPPGSCESSFWYQNDSLNGRFTFQGWSKNNQTSSWNWDFGDGTTASGQTVSHSFPDTNAVYTVCLTTTGNNSDGTTCTFSSCQDVNIYKPSPCESSFWYYSESSAPVFTFEGYAKNNRINTWTWDFGDGTTASGQKVSHTFNDFKTNHNVCLTTTGTSTDGESCTFNSCIEIYSFVPSPCENHFKASTDDGRTYSFSGYLNSGNAAEYYWDFGDGETASGQFVKHTFRGTKAELFYNVCLTTIMNDPSVNDTCSSTSCQLIYPGEIYPSCQAIISAIPDSSGYTFHFENISQVTNSMFFWDFGDGSQSTEAKPVHSYSSRGLYMACLTLLDSVKNCKSYTCLEIWVNVIEPDCKASFYTLPAGISNSDGSALSFKFVNSSAYGYTNQEWSFGDGSGSFDVNPVHTYAASGIYYACLTIWDSSGICKSNYCMDIYVGKVTGNYTVSGTVLAGNTPADQGIVWLIGPNNNYNAETQIDSKGNYYFTGVPYGKYYIYAMLTPGSSYFFKYMPTYYKSSMSWQGATIVTAGVTDTWYSISLVPSVYNNQGDAIINGSVHWTDASGTPMSPASDVAIVLYNSEGEPVAYTFPENDGTYQFNNLPFGEYMLQVEMQGKAMQRFPVTVTESSTNVNIDFGVNESAIYFLGIDVLTKPTISAGNPFPNPVTENLYLEINVPASVTATVEVIDMQGRIVHRELKELANGNNRISIKSGNFVKGVYQLRIKTDGQKPIQRRFIK